MLQPRILPDRRVVMRHMRRTITDHDLYIVGIGRAAGIVQHNRSPRISPHLDQRVPERRPLRALAPNRNNSRLVSLSLRWNRYDHRLFEGSKCPSTDPVCGHKGGAEALVTALRMHSDDWRLGVAPHRHLPR